MEGRQVPGSLNLAAVVPAAQIQPAVSCPQFSPAVISVFREQVDLVRWRQSFCRHEVMRGRWNQR
jgi:hypothetical protein